MSLKPKPFFYLFILCGISFVTYSQDLKYARVIVDTLASPFMDGRGYVNSGDKKAADFIENEFKKNDLVFFDQSYRQEFSFPVNTFPGEIELSINTQKLIPGKDFIISSPSSATKGSYAIAFANEQTFQTKRKRKKFFRQNFTEKIILVDDTGKQTKVLQGLITNPCKAKGVIVLKDKLTWSVSQDTGAYPVFEVLRSSIKEASSAEYKIENKFIPNYTSQNLVGYIKGSQYPDSFIVFSAHYDHLGRMGKDSYFPGANDNASGIAMLLNLAKHYAKNQPKYSVAFMAFGAEEVGLLGSDYYTRHPMFPLKNIKFLINMDIMGTGDEGITVVNATEHKKEFDQLVNINTKQSYLKQVKPRGKTANSDHYHFSEKGVKTFFIYTMGGIKAYHDIYDRAETLPLTEFEDVFRLLNDFVTELTLRN